eukprot:3211430-Alexandrium_andersonii.AAC.1
MRARGSALRVLARPSRVRCSQAAPPAGALCEALHLVCSPLALAGCLRGEAECMRSLRVAWGGRARRLVATLPSFSG